MDVVILNGNADQTNAAFDAYLAELSAGLQAAGHTARTLMLRDMVLRQCIGCFNCWLKTPGVCVAKDQHGDLLRAYVNSGLAVFASPLRMGFTSALLKRATDKILPVLMPYVDASTGESRHFLRYTSSPRMVVVYQDEPGTEDEDRTIVAELWRRLARNAHSSVAACVSTTTPVKELTDAIAGA